MQNPNTAMGVTDPGAIALLHDLNRWREQLARSIARNNHGLQSDTIAATANRIIGRLLFLRIAEDRRLISAGILGQIQSASDPLDTLSAFFLQTGDPWREPPVTVRFQTNTTELLAIEDRVIQKIFERLCQPEQRYDLRSLSTSMIAEVFDQHFTSAIRRSAAHQAVVVETRDTLHSQGTPTPSSDLLSFMVHQSLDGVFANRNPDDLLPVRILDIACGSGRVLLAAYKDILNGSGSGRHTLTERQEHLLASIHGVDLDPHAVAVTKMLLFFELCADEQAETYPEKFMSFAGSVFRALDRNILCGNSLIAADVDSEESIAFSPAHERHRIHPLDWQSAFPEVLRAGGFDAVLGNLPDGPLQPHEWVHRYFQRHYSVYHQHADRSVYFIERGLSLLCPGGTFGCVAGNRWLRAKSGAPVRKYLLSFQIEEIADSGTEAEDKLHPSLCVLRITRCPPSHAFFVAQLNLNGAEPLEEQVHGGRFPLAQMVLGTGGWTLRDTRVQDLLKKVFSAGTSLKEVVMGRVHSGIISGLDDAFVIDARQRKELIEASPKSKPLIRPFLSARDIVRYSSHPLSRSLIFIPQGWTNAQAGDQAGWQWIKKKYPALARHLKPFAERAKERKHQGDFWWECVCEPGVFDRNQPRIIFPGSGEFPVFAFDTGDIIPDRHTRFISSSSLFLLAVLNSRLSTFLLRVTAHEVQENKRTPVWERIAALPIYTTDFDNSVDAERYDRMVALVKEMLELHKHLNHAKTDREKRLVTQEIESTNRQIDSLVYGLYGLTADEIAVVEEAIVK
ncbi:MAG: class I SAM-dependent methyltransferase [Methanoregula sp.]|nr:class I SAM-dependent methyltransferase [Methanoregula sp.]